MFDDDKVEKWGLLKPRKHISDSPRPTFKGWLALIAFWIVIGLFSLGVTVAYLHFNSDKGSGLNTERDSECIVLGCD